MAQYEVRVVEEYRWNRAQVSGREFTKTPMLLPATSVNDEMRRSPLLHIREVEGEADTAAGSRQTPDVSDDAEERPDATDAAAQLAAEAGIDLHGLAGSGRDGRVLVADVRALVKE